MTPASLESVLARLAAAVHGYRTDLFDLGEDLDRLERVRRATAPEAVVLYCARILEALAACALRAVSLEPSSNVFSNLDTLQQYSLIPVSTRCWAHALRRAGNAARHVLRRIDHDDAELALLYLERWLEWFFRAFPYGHRLPTLTRDGGPLWLSGGNPLRALVERLEHLEGALEAGGALPDPQAEGLLRTPELPAVLAEWLLDAGRADDADAVLDKALARFPEDLRLRQLWGIYLSRTGGLDEARACLEELAARYADDSETAGILAGVYKRLWLQQRDRSALLDKAGQLYRQNWERSNRTNEYLGINAACVALWRGRPADARALAEAVSRLLRARAAVLAARARDRLGLDFWDQVALAEAELLLGRLAEARRLYREAFACGGSIAGRIEVSRRQLGENLRALGLTDSVDDFLTRAAAGGPDRPIRIGVTGHRVLPAADALRGRVLEVLEELRRERGSLAAVSSLAEGADRLLAGLVLAPPFAGALLVVLPLELTDYRQDFASETSLAEFQSLLSQADEIVFPPLPTMRKVGRDTPPPLLTSVAREAGYEWAGQEVVNRCDVLVALWDGQPSRGRGGTAEIVAYARQAGRPLIWIRTMPPHEIVQERMEILRSQR